LYIVIILDLIDVTNSVRTFLLVVKLVINMVAIKQETM